MYALFNFVMFTKKKKKIYFKFSYIKILICYVVSLKLAFSLLTLYTKSILKKRFILQTLRKSFINLLHKRSLW